MPLKVLYPKKSYCVSLKYWSHLIKYIFKEANDCITLLGKCSVVKYEQK